ncbi:glycosyltransferase, partial [Arthrospira platensis SPKY2]
GSRLAEVMDEVRSGVGVLSDELNLLLAGFPAVESILSRFRDDKTKLQMVRTDDGVVWKPEVIQESSKLLKPLKLKERFNNFSKSIYYEIENTSGSEIENTSGNFTFYDGRIESSNSDFIDGWAVDTENFDKTLILDVYVDNLLISSCKAHKFRKDLAQKFNSHGRYGFRVEVPKSLMFKNKVTVSVRFRDTNLDLRNSPVNIWVGSPGKKQNYYQKYIFYLYKNIYKNHESISNITPKVAMIILNLNGAFVLDKLFASFQIHNTYKNIEIIVVDHNSHDETVKLCEFWSEYLPIQVIKRNKNYSFSESNNLAVNQSDAPLLFFVNNDMMFCQDIIPELVRISQVKTVGIVGLKLLDILDSNKYGFPPTQHLGIQFDFYDSNKIFLPYDIRYSSHLLKLPISRLG